METSTATSTNDNQIDWDKYNSRTDDNKKTDVLSTCYDNNVNAKTASQILFSAGYIMTAVNVQKFYDGRTRWLLEKSEKKES